MRRHPRVGRQIAGGNGLDRLERLHRRTSGSRFTVHGSSFQLRLEQPPQLPLRAIELRLDRAERQLQRFGQILVLHALQVVRRDQQPVIRRQPRDRLLQPIAQLEIGELADPAPAGVTRSRVVRSSIETTGTRTPACCSCAADVGDDAVDPGGEAGLAAEIGQPAVRRAGRRPARDPRPAIDPAPCGRSRRTPGPCIRSTSS